MQPFERPRLIAFYLPQFHPIPENDRWWGTGFTEWRNVARARPQFPRHYQPHIPRDLGFYDLRLHDSRIAQAELARSYGVSGFCYYHYWFEGRKLLNRPIDEMMSSGEPEFPFCLCWANEGWNRSWDGRAGDYLIRQSYSLADDRAHIQDLLPKLGDPRYIRVNGKPLLLVYRVGSLPSPSRTAEVWRETCQRAGVGEPYLCAVNSHLPATPPPDGFDACVEFQPDWGRLPPLLGGRWGSRLIARSLRYPDRDGALRVYSYQEHARRAMSLRRSAYKQILCVMPSWDNTARRGRTAVVFHGATPTAYAKWLRWTLERTRGESGDEDVVFVNAWNEWGEGCHLEPCLRWERSYLEATRAALETWDTLSAHGDRVGSGLSAASYRRDAQVRA